MVVATVLELVSATEVVGVLKMNVPLLFVVQLVGVPDTMDVNMDDEVVVLEADVEVSLGNDVSDDVVLTIIEEVKYPPEEDGILLYIQSDDRLASNFSLILTELEEAVMLGLG